MQSGKLAFGLKKQSGIQREIMDKISNLKNYPGPDIKARENEPD
jgi:hypothetical protein